MEKTTEKNDDIHPIESYNKSFVRLVDKSTIPTCPILDVEIAAINMEWLLSYLLENIKSPEGNLLAGDYICVSNVHTTVTAYERPYYLEIQNGGLMSIPDGGPLSSIGRKRGYRSMSRISGPDLMEKVFQVSSRTGYRHYFYGGTPETLKKLYAKLNHFYPGMQVVGMYSPPFRALTDEEDEEIIRLINNSSPDFVWVGLGAPKQETWMALHQGKVNGLMVGVGAGFDYHAGNISRAPKWMQKHSLEWLYRLMQEPRRLLGRYVSTNGKFIMNALLRGK